VWSPEENQVSFKKKKKGGRKEMDAKHEVKIYKKFKKSKRELYVSQRII
jgi:hypothetical protein